MSTWKYGPDSATLFLPNGAGIKLDASGVTAGTVRVATVADANVTFGTTSAPAAAPTHATNSVVAADGSITQTTNARTAGVASMYKASLIGLAGDTSGGTYVAFDGVATPNGGSALFVHSRMDAGFTAFLDASACATGECDVILADNVASAFEFRQGANVYLQFYTVDSNEAVVFSKRAKMLDSVAVVFGTGDDDSISHDGTNTTWTHGMGNLVIDNTTAAGSTFVDLGTDSNATKFAVRNNSGTQMLAITGDSAAAFLGTVSTTDGVASGTARRVGGIAFRSIVASTAITGTTETQTVFDQSYTMPANTIKEGTVLRVRGFVFATATTGAETFTIAVMCGSIQLCVSDNIDIANTNMVYVDTTFTCRVGGATGTLVGGGVAIGSGRAAAFTTNHGLFTGSASTSVSDAIDFTAANVIGIAIDRQGSATDGDSARLDNLTVEIIG